jgi:hypothetical protein
MFISNVNSTNGTFKNRKVSQTSPEINKVQKFQPFRPEQDKHAFHDQTWQAMHHQMPNWHNKSLHLPLSCSTWPMK